jgi:hypothetical protein
MLCACPSEAKGGGANLLKIGVYVLYLNVWHGVVHANIFELFDHGMQTLDQLLLSDLAWARWMRRTDGMIQLKYSYQNTTYFVENISVETADSVTVRAKLPLSAVEYLCMDVNEGSMMVVQDDGSTRQIKSELTFIIARPTYISVLTAELTDTGTLDCILKAFVKAIRHGV